MRTIFCVLALLLLHVAFANLCAPGLEMAIKTQNVRTPATSASHSHQALVTKRDVQGNYFVAGVFSGTLTFANISLTNTDDNLGRNIYFAKFTSDWRVLWAKQAGSAGNEPASAFSIFLEIGAQGDMFASFLVAGTQNTIFYDTTNITSAVGNIASGFIKVNAQGELAWLSYSTAQVLGTTLDTDGNLYAYCFGTGALAFPPLTATLALGSAIGKINQTGQFQWIVTTDGFGINNAMFTLDAQQSVFVVFRAVTTVNLGSKTATRPFPGLSSVLAIGKIHFNGTVTFLTFADTQSVPSDGTGGFESSQIGRGPGNDFVIISVYRPSRVASRGITFLAFNEQGQMKYSLLSQSTTISYEFVTPQVDKYGNAYFVLSPPKAAPVQFLQYRLQSKGEQDSFVVQVDPVGTIQKTFQYGGPKAVVASHFYFDNFTSTILLTANINSHAFFEEQATAMIGPEQSGVVVSIFNGCTSCKAGYFKNVTSSDKCTACPSTTYSEAGATSCVPCPYSSDSTVSSAQSGCKPCRAGNFVSPQFSNATTQSWQTSLYTSQFALTKKNTLIFAGIATNLAFSATLNFPGLNVIIAHTDSEATNVLWVANIEHTNGESLNTYISGVDTDYNGNIYVTGKVAQVRQFNISGSVTQLNEGSFVLKISHQGTVISYKHLPNMNVNLLKLGNDSNYYITGSTTADVNMNGVNMTHNENNPAFIAKLHDTGILRWILPVGKSCYYYRNSRNNLVINENGGAYAGYGGGSQVGDVMLLTSQMFVIRFTLDGVIKAMAVSSTALFFSCPAVGLDFNDNMYIFGIAPEIAVSVQFGQYIASLAFDDYFYFKFDSKGVALFGQSIGSSQIDSVGETKIDSLGNVYALLLPAFTMNGLSPECTINVPFQVQKTSAHFVRFNSSGACLYASYVSNDFGMYANSDSFVDIDSFGNSVIYGRTVSNKALLGRVSSGCTSCPFGTYSSLSFGSIRSSSCVGCPQGTFSNSTEVKSAAECTKCPVGTYNELTGQIACTKCPAGTSSQAIGLAISSLCFSCVAGTYSAEGSSVCTSCIAGKYSTQVGASSNLTCIDCPMGTYSLSAGASSVGFCIACQAGSYSNQLGANSSDTCKLCPQGTYSTVFGAQSKSQCILCPVGTYSAVDGASSFSSCTPCPSGTFSNSTGATDISQCTACSAGYFAKNPKSSSCEPCALGRYSPSSNTIECLFCPQGTYSDALNSTFCKPCLPGSFNPQIGGNSYNSCILCEKGSYSNTQGSVSCQACASGQYSENKGQQNCFPCRQGTFVDPFSPTRCLPCKPGTFSTTVGASSDAVCQPCPIGSFSNAWNASSCESCKIGFFSNSTGSTYCYPCSAGSIATSASSSSCSSCRPGTYADSALQKCIDCPEGSYSSVEGLTSVQQCLPCDVGTFSDKPGASSCTSCLAGTYNDQTGQRRCKLCGPGTYNEASGGASIASCKLCSSGSYNPNNGSSSQIACTKCGPGFFGTVIGATSSSTCVRCARGSYSDFEGLGADASKPMPCTLCQRGTFSLIDGANSNTSCLPCQSGTFSTVIGSSSSNDCKPCDAGKYSASGMESCTNCARGTFSSAGSATCSKCPLGQFADKPGSPACMSCSAGTFADREGSWECSPCPLGTFASHGASSKCLPCESSMFCNVGASKPMLLSEVQNKSALQLIDPYFAPEVKPTIEKLTPYIITRIVVICAVVLLLFILCIIPLGIILATWKCSKVRRNISLLVSKIDAYVFGHPTDMDKSPVKRQTALGGIFTIVFYAGAFLVVFLLAMDLADNNIDRRTFIAPEQVLPAAISTFIQGDFSLSLTLHNYNDLGCQAELSVSGLEPNMNVSFVKNDTASTCVATIVCKQCYLSGSAQYFRFKWSQLFAMASAIDYTITLPHFINNTNFVLRERVVPLEPHTIFKGSEQATEVSLSLTKSFYTVSTADSFIFNIISGNNVANRTTSGYVATHFPTKQGSRVDATTFNQKSGLQVWITFNSDSSVFRIVEDGKSTILDLVSKIAALVGLVGTIAGALLLKVEECIPMICKRKPKDGSKPEQRKSVDKLHLFDSSVEDDHADVAHQVQEMRDAAAMHAQHQ